MRLTDIRKILNDNIGKLVLQQGNVIQNNQNYVRFGGILQFKEAVNEIERTGVLKEDIESLKQTQIFTSLMEIVTLNPSEASLLLNRIKELKKLVQSILNSLNQISPPIKENTVYIKFPSIKDFANIADTANELQTILSQTLVNPKIDGEIDIIGVEEGSIWFKVCVGNSLAVKLIGDLMWASMIVHKKRTEFDITKENISALKNMKDVNVIKSIEEAQKDELKNIVDLEANNIFNNNFNDEDKDQIGRLGLFIDKMSILLSKGMDIQPSLEMPKEIQVYFPDKKNLLSITSKIPQIEKPKNE